MKNKNSPGKKRSVGPIEEEIIKTGKRRKPGPEWPELL